MQVIVFIIFSFEDMYLISNKSRRFHLCLVDVDVRKKVASAAEHGEAEVVHHACLGRLVDGALAYEVVKVDDGVERRALGDLDAGDLLEVVAVLVGEDLSAREALDGDNHFASRGLVWRSSNWRVRVLALYAFRTDMFSQV